MNNPSTATLEDISSDHDCANAHSDEGDWFLAMKGITFDEEKSVETVEELEKKMHHITELEYLEAKGETLNFDQQVLLALKHEIVQQLQLVKMS
jgi:hypothetical protein